MSQCCLCDLEIPAGEEAWMPMVYGRRKRHATYEDCVAAIRAWADGLDIYSTPLIDTGA